METHKCVRVSFFLLTFLKKFLLPSPPSTDQDQALRLTWGEGATTVKMTSMYLYVVRTGPKVGFNAILTTDDDVCCHSFCDDDDCIDVMGLISVCCTFLEDSLQTKRILGSRFFGLGIVPAICPYHV